MKKGNDEGAVKSAAIGAALRVPRAPELLAARVKAKIVNGELREGDMLPAEVKMMEEFGVSRPTVREAYRILEAERLVSVARGARGGAVVHAPDPVLIANYTLLVLQAEQVTIDEVYQTLAFVEPPIVRHLATSAWKTAPAALAECLAAENEAVSNLPAFAKAVAAFHKTLVELSGNRPMIHLMAALREVVERHHTRVVAMRHYGHPEEEIRADVALGLKSHKKLIDLITGRDADKAEAHWRRHWDKSYKTWVTGFEGKTILELFKDV